MVLHYGESGSGAQPSEIAWLGVTTQQGVQAPDVVVYVSKWSLETMKKVYAPLGRRVTVEPLSISESELDVEAFLSLMAVDSEQTPLYIQVLKVSTHSTYIHTIADDKDVRAHSRSCASWATSSRSRGSEPR